MCSVSQVQGHSFDSRKRNARRMDSPGVVVQLVGLSIVIAIMIIMIVTTHHVVDAGLVSASEAVPVGFAVLRRQVRVAIFIAILNIGTTMIIKVLAGSFNSVKETLTVKLIELIWRSIPRPLRRTHAPICRTGQMRHANVVSATESFTICGPHGRRYIRVAIFIAIVHFRAPMVIEVLVGSFDPIVEAAPLNIVPGVRWSLPVVAILAKARRLWSRSCRVGARRREQHESSTSNECCELKLVEIHLANAPFVNNEPIPETSGRNRTARTLDLPMGVLHVCVNTRCRQQLLFKCVGRAAKKCPAIAPGILSGEKLDVRLIVVIVPHVFHGTPVSFTKAFSEVPAGISFDWGVFVHFVVIGIVMAVFAHIVPSSFDAFVKSATLCVAIFRWRLGPAVLIVIVVLGEGRIGNGLRFKSMCLERT
jgi:hypothetical protein